MLEIVDLHFDYQDRPLLRNISFQLLAGGLLHLRGANGAGKTTLLKIISGLHPPESGKILYLGQPIVDSLGNYKNHICFVGHKLGINPLLTLKENCMFDMHYTNTKMDVMELSYIFNLEPYLDVPCSILSSGQKRQVALLRLWMTSAKLWLLDEPFIALDDTAQQILMNKIEQHRERGGAVLLTSHQALSLDRSKYEEFYL